MDNTLTVPTLDALAIRQHRIAQHLRVLSAAQTARAIHCDGARYRGRRRRPGALLDYLDAAAPLLGIAGIMLSASLVGVALAGVVIR